MALHQRDLRHGHLPYGERAWLDDEGRVVAGPGAFRDPTGAEVPEPLPPERASIDPYRLAGALLVTVGAAGIWMAFAAILWWLLG